jgi:hypothetical protein
MHDAVAQLQACLDRRIAFRLAFITIPLPDRPTASGCMDTIGSPWRGWPPIPPGV